MKTLKNWLFGAALALVLAADSKAAAKPERVEFTSTALAAAAYQAEGGQLTLWFRNGGVYVYREVPATLHAQLLAAPSKGGYYHRHLRGRFAADCVQVSTPGRSATRFAAR
jgi:hypothetical protein